MDEKDKKDLNEVKEQLDRLLSRSKDALFRGKEEVVRMGHVARLHFEILGFERQQRQLFEDLGKLLHKLSKKKGEDVGRLGSAVKQLLDKTGKLDQAIAKAKKQIDTMDKPETTTKTKSKSTKRTTKKKSVK